MMRSLRLVAGVRWWWWGGGVGVCNSSCCAVSTPNGPKSLLSMEKRRHADEMPRLFSSPRQKFPWQLPVLRGITKTLEAAYLLKTGGRETLGGEGKKKKVSASSISLLVDGVGLLERAELQFLPSGPTFGPV